MHFVSLDASGDVYDSTTTPALNQLGPYRPAEK